jgi:hypothetical protein
MARARSWISENSENKNFFWICVILVAVFSVAIPVFKNPGVVLVLFVCCLLIAYLGREVESRDKKLLGARFLLLDIAFQECRCEQSAPKGYEGCCYVCRARGVLEEHFPGAIEELMQERLNAFAFEETYIPKELAASYVAPEVLTWLRERRLDRVGPERFVLLTFTVRKLRK